MSALGDPLTALSIVSLDYGQKELVGRVLDLKGGTLLLQPGSLGASPVNLIITPSTLFFSGRQSSSETSVHVGDTVRVATTSGSSQIAADVEILLAQFVGRVTSLSRDSIVLKDASDDFVTVHVTPATRIMFFATPARMNDVVLGARVAAAGVSSPDSLAIDASTLVIISRVVPTVGIHVANEYPVAVW